MLVRVELLFHLGARNRVEAAGVKHLVPTQSGRERRGYVRGQSSSVVLRKYNCCAFVVSSYAPPSTFCPKMKHNSGGVKAAGGGRDSAKALQREKPARESFRDGSSVVRMQLAIGPRGWGDLDERRLVRWIGFMEVLR